MIEHKETIFKYAGEYDKLANEFIEKTINLEIKMNKKIGGNFSHEFYSNMYGWAVRKFPRNSFTGAVEVLTDSEYYEEINKSLK